MGSELFAHNPILPAGTFVPDAEARQWADGRMYIYGSYDIGDREGYCSTQYHVYSSADLVHWTDHGESFASAGPNDAVAWSSADLYAPDCICKDGVYYLYFCLSDGTEGVASSPSPDGPFRHAVQITGMDGIDPGVFVDDDGQAYIYWGQFDKVRAAKLKPNMMEIDESTVVQPLSVAEHNFHEGSSMRKRDGVYYYVYADTGRRDERPTCLGYATSDSPLGPFTYRGVVIDNYGCDPKVWNNHGCIAEFNGKWYVFYHRSTRAGVYSRKVCVEPITFSPDGTIPEVEMTSQGVGGPINALSHIHAELACMLQGSVRVETCGEGGECLGAIADGDFAAYKYVDFGSGVTGFAAEVSGHASGSSMEVRLDSATGPLVGLCDAGTRKCAIEGAMGVHALYLVFRGCDTCTGGSSGLLGLRSFSFSA